MNRYRRQYNRAKTKRTYERRKSEGWVEQTIWMTKPDREAIAVRAKQLGMTISVVVTAAFKVGLRNVTTSDMIRADRQWHEKVKRPSEVQFRSVDPRRALATERRRARCQPPMTAA